MVLYSCFAQLVPLHWVKVKVGLWVRTHRLRSGSAVSGDCTRSSLGPKISSRESQVSAGTLEVESGLEVVCQHFKYIYNSVIHANEEHIQMTKEKCNH